MKTINNKPRPRLRTYSLLLFFLGLACIRLHGQTIARDNNDASGTVCPKTTVKYKINDLGSYSACFKQWTATGGTIQGYRNQSTVEVEWNDTPGLITKLELSLTICGSGVTEPAVAPFKELVRSVKDQPWGSYTNSYNIDFCSTTTLRITMPIMTVQGTGQWYNKNNSSGMLFIPVQQVEYRWTLPAGWTANGFNGTTATTTTEFIDIRPVNLKCAEPGIVSVVGSIRNTCNDVTAPPAYSSTASITLGGVRPNVTMAPQFGYSGVSTACNKTPITFTASINQPFSCLTGYTWTTPAGWTINSQNGNTAVLQPSGSASDAGKIYATANFACGSTYRSGDVTITYTAPSVASSANPICSTSQFTVSNAPGVAVGWSSSPAGLSFNASGFANRANNFNGQVIVTANLSNAGCSVNVPTTVWVGTVKSSDIQLGSLSTYPYVCPNNTYSVILEPSAPGSTYEIGVLNGTFTQRPTPNFYWVHIGNYTPSQYVDAEITARINNGCGWSDDKFLSLYSDPISCPAQGGCEFCLFSVSPNPSTDEINVEVKEEEWKSAKVKGWKEEYQIVLKDNTGQEHVKMKTKERKVKLDTRNIPQGTYYLQIEFNKTLSTKRVIIGK